MRPAPVLQKFLAVICGQSQRAAVPYIQLDQVFCESADLLVHLANARVIERHDVFSLTLQAVEAYVAAVPI